jgi:hypothetical protein
MAINFPATPTLNQTYTFNGRTWTYNGVGWQATGASGLSVYTKTDFTATAAQTTFSVTYTVGFVDVYYNGSKLSITEYTATNGTSVVLGTACAVNDIVETIAWTVSTTLNPALGVATATSLAIGGATIGTNALAVTGTTALSGLLTAAGGVSSTLTTDATSATTGSILTAGGISCQKALWVGTTSRLVGNVQCDANIGAGVTPLARLQGYQSGNGGYVLGVGVTNTATPYAGVILNDTAVALNAGPTAQLTLVNTRTPTVGNITGIAFAATGRTSADVIEYWTLNSVVTATSAANAQTSDLVFSTKTTASYPFADTERLRLTQAGNLGIGRTPTQPLQVKVGTDQVFSLTSASSHLQIQAINDAANAFTQLELAGSFITFAPASTEAGRFDTSGRLCLGTTGSGGGANSLTIGSFGTASNASNAIHLANSGGPNTNPSGGGTLYASAGRLYWIGSSGTTTLIAAA